VSQGLVAGSIRNGTDGRAQIEQFVSYMFENSSDPAKFKPVVRDFLISLKEFSGDNAELYIEEKEAETEQKAREEREAAMRVPGMLKPAQLDDDADL
jgi:exportin-1